MSNLTIYKNEYASQRLAFSCDEATRFAKPGGTFFNLLQEKQQTTDETQP